MSRCPVCGGRGGAPCRACVAALEPAPTRGPVPPGLEALHAALAYDGAGRELVARLKYRNARRVVGWLAEVMAALVDPGGFDVVTWAPTSEGRRRERGFDQAELLARAVARRARRPCCGLLRRAPGPHQTGRSAAERQRGPVFRGNGRARPVGQGRVLVVDDVVTTGATLAAAATALRQDGIEQVTAVVAARTP